MGAAQVTHPQPPDPAPGAPEEARTRRLPLSALLAASLISSLGSTLTVVAIPWFVLVTTGSAAKTGLTTAVYTLPVLVAGIFGGALVDRLGFSRSSVYSDLGAAVVMGLIPLLYYTSGLAFWELLLLVFLRGVIVNPGGTARMSMVADLAALAGMPLERANSAAQAMQRLALLFGPPLAGVLIALMGVGNVLWLDAASFVVSAAVYLVAVVPYAAGVRPREAGRSYVQETLDGFRFLHRDRPLLWLVGVISVSSLITEPFYTIVMPVYAREVYGSAVDLGLMFSALAAGSLAGLLLYGLVGQRLPRRFVIVVGFIVRALSFWVLVFRPPLALLLASIVVNATLFEPLNPLSMAVIQERTPDNLRGRVFSTVGALAASTLPLGTMIGGVLIGGLGLIPAVVVLAAASLAQALSLPLLPAIRRLDRVA